MKLPRNLASTIDRIARDTIGKDWNLYAVLFQHWPEIVGESYAKTTTPVKIVFPRGKRETEKWASGKRSGGLLTIRVPQGLTMEFTFLNETIRTRINGFFGYEAVERIQLEPVYGRPPAPPKSREALSPEVQKELNATTQTVDNEEIRQALEQLGQSILISHQKD